MGEVISRWARLHGWLPIVSTVAALVLALGSVLWFALGLQAKDASQERQITRLQKSVDDLYRLYEAVVKSDQVQEGRWDVLDDRIAQIIIEARANAEARGDMRARLRAIERDFDRHEATLRRLYVPPAAIPQPPP